MNMSQLGKCGNKTCAFIGEAKDCIIRIKQQAKLPSKPTRMVTCILKDHFDSTERFRPG